jgi:hypothetical protein
MEFCTRARRELVTDLNYVHALEWQVQIIDLDK